MNLAEKVTATARGCFGENMLFSFVGGSYAAGRDQPNSDVDLLVLLKHPAGDDERKFAGRYRYFHQSHGLKMGHCGEILDRKTLEHLLQMTDRILELVPLILELGCYHSDCIVSIFRKGDVVAKLLADPKTCVWGDRELLLKFEEYARAYFTKSPMPRIQTAIGHLLYSETTEADRKTHRIRRYYESQCKTGNFFETPVGVGLERWFGDWLDIPPFVCSRLSKTSFKPILARNTCPRNLFPQGSVEDFYLKYQCLGSYYRRFSHGRR